LGVAPFWGKSDAGGRPNLLLQHLFDAAAVGELIWDRYMAPSFRAKIDGCCGGNGRKLLSLLCALHDVGKATPAFQDKVSVLAGPVRAYGLTWVSPLPKVERRWHHTLAGGVIVDSFLSDAGWQSDAVAWVVPMITGHHGMVPVYDMYRKPRRHGHGRDQVWRDAQRTLVLTVVESLEVDLKAVMPTITPSRAVQLAVSGAIIMADWIASDGHRFPGVYDADVTSMAAARLRAERAWVGLGLHGGWRDPSRLAGPGFFQQRFGRFAIRPVQEATVAVAEGMPAAGLMLVEAPMGEGKTEAALAAAEVLARRFGADGIFVGMPTQATSDAMFERVLAWADSVDPRTPIGLLHGKRRFNPRWRALWEARFADIDDDEFGCGDDYGVGNGSHAGRVTVVPAEWFLGPKRGLLMPVTIGTIDQLLHAATRTRHVMLRHLGLVGRVVVLDEVHAYDVYMMQFLTEALRWLGDGGVPVVLLSATLPPATRSRLTSAYLQGALRSVVDSSPAALAVVDGYPAVRWVAAVGGQAVAGGQTTSAWRASVPVKVEVLEEGPRERPDRVVGLVRDALVEGGCALVVRNTVARAQETFRALQQAVGGDGIEVVLLHARLMMGDRVDRTARVLEVLGPPDRSSSPDAPRRMVVVATQLAEQSFDVDVDLLVTDLAPIDLLLQRIGRLHRHDRPAGARPSRVSSARVVIAGMVSRVEASPTFPAGSEAVYGRYLLLKAAALVVDSTAGAGSWSVPAQVPDLVSRGYDLDADVPAAWRDDLVAAWNAMRRRTIEREDRAGQFVLAGSAELHRTDLSGLHDKPTRSLDDDDAVAAVVRDGADSVEAVVLRRRGDLRVTFDGVSLGPGDTRISVPEVAEAVIQSVVRLPAKLTDAALRELTTLIESSNDPWLARLRVLELDDANVALLGGRRLTYNRDLGLIDEPTP
jgi:CRISPR-associated endonuclease/helicase Cas3